MYTKFHTIFWQCLCLFTYCDPFCPKFWLQRWKILIGCRRISRSISKWFQELIVRTKQSTLCERRVKHCARKWCQKLCGFICPATCGFVRILLFDHQMVSLHTQENSMQWQIHMPPNISPSEQLCSQIQHKLFKCHGIQEKSKLFDA